MNAQSPLLSVQDLSVIFRTPSGPFTAVDKVSFDVETGQTVSLVGESGSGKSVTAMSIMRLLPYPMASHTPESSITFKGTELITLEEKKMREFRGEKIGMIFQEPQSALNPLHTIERQIAEMLLVHQGMKRDDAQKRVLELLELVGLNRLKQRLNAYPHELSGGQRQRVMIAMALANNPKLLIADEPTTALDVTIQAQILELLDDLKKELSMSLLLITHDLTIVEKMADHTCVMQHGKLVEKNATSAIFANPQEDYTQRLLDSIPSGTPRPVKQDAKQVLKAEDVNVSFPTKRDFFGRAKEYVHAVQNISLDLKAGETLGVVGESGSGKTTLGMALLRLIDSRGKIVFLGEEISELNRRQMRPHREDMQIVFQDPYASLSPRMSVAQIISEGLDIHHKNLSKDEKTERVIKVLKEVHLDPETRHRYPHEFSGGQRQRISIARAMILEPDLIVLDEPTSALDVSIQCEIVDLLRELQEQRDLSFLFISHDLRVVRAMAHKILVMKDGQMMEEGTTDEIFDNPRTDYTRALMDAALNLKARHT